MANPKNSRSSLRKADTNSTFSKNLNNLHRRQNAAAECDHDERLMHVFRPPLDQFSQLRGGDFVPMHFYWMPAAILHA